MPGTLTFDTLEAVALEGPVTVEAVDAGTCSFGGVPPGVHTLTNATGRLTLYEENVTRLTVKGVNFSKGYESARYDWRVENATIAFTTVAESFAYCAHGADGGRVTVHGSTAAQGRVARVPADTQDSYGDGLERVRVHWKKGWPFVGRDMLMTTGMQDGFPVLDGPRIGLHGRVLAHFDGGNVTFTDTEGNTHAIRLSSWSREEHVGAPMQTDASDDVLRWLVFDGTVEDATLPVGRAWGVAAPTLTWRIDGELAWSRATGTYDVGEGRVAFRDARVDGAGAVTVTVREPGTGTGIAVDHYDASGGWERLRVNGQAVVLPAPVVSAATTVAAVSVLALLVAFLFEAPREALVRVVGAFYSRIRPSDTLAHPRRRRILEIAQEEPGIHLRALHRRAGGGWGGFREHVKRLAEAGLVRLEKTAGYTTVFPGTMPAAAVVAGNVRMPSKVAQRIVEAVAANATPTSVAELRERVGVSDQLLRYHLKRLDAQGLVTLSWDADGRRVVTGPDAPTPEARAGDDEA